MKRELQKCTETYDLISNKGVFPISRTDALIIEKLTTILVESDANPDLIKTLRDWKRIPDEDILGLFDSIEFNLEESIEGEMKKTTDFIQIGSHILSIKSLFSVRKVDSYDTSRFKPVYKILINETENINVINGNKEVEFDNSAEREVFLEDLIEKLSQFTNIRFL